MGEFTDAGVLLRKAEGEGFGGEEEGGGVGVVLLIVLIVVIRVLCLGYDLD